MSDLYSTLGVSRAANSEELRRAYKTLARRYHPDISTEPGAEAKFKAISRAYDVLSDPTRRALYDEFGEDSLKIGFDPVLARAAMAEQDAARSNAADFFSQFFSGGNAAPWEQEGAQEQPQREPQRGAYYQHYARNSQSRRAAAETQQRQSGPAQPSGARRGMDERVEVTVPFLTAIRGGQINVPSSGLGPCRTCTGTGRRDLGGCGQCQGTGRMQLGDYGFEVPCDRCRGTGKSGSPCATCAGTGQVAAERSRPVNVPAGTDDGEVLHIAGHGAPGLAGGAAGALVVTVRVEPHPFLNRDGDDLIMELPITIGEAVAGGPITAPTPWGQVRLRLPPGSASGSRLRLRGYGIRRTQARGDLYMILRPTPPSAPDERAKALAKELDAHYETGVRDGMGL